MGVINFKPKKSYRYYVAYGSNLNVGQMKYRCPDAVPIGTAWIDGYALMYKGSKTGAYLTIEKKENSRVPVVIWKVSATDEKSLDRYEGYPTFYYKKELPKLRVTFFKSDKKKGFKPCKYNVRNLDCFVYIMHEDHAFGIPTQTYIDTCEAGYKIFGFDTSILDEALSYTADNISESRYTGYVETLTEEQYYRLMGVYV